MKRLLLLGAAIGAAACGGSTTAPPKTVSPSASSAPPSSGSSAAPATASAGASQTGPLPIPPPAEHKRFSFAVTYSFEGGQQVHLTWTVTDNDIIYKRPGNADHPCSAIAQQGDGQGVFPLPAGNPDTRQPAQLWFTGSVPVVNNFHGPGTYNGPPDVTFIGGVGDETFDSDWAATATIDPDGSGNAIATGKNAQKQPVKMSIEWKCFDR